jgi:hypothetical protein
MNHIMNKSALKTILCGLAASVILYSCDGDDDNPPPPPGPVPDNTFTQSFESMANAQTQGWIFKYQSNDPDFTYPWEVKAGGAFDGSNSLYSFNDYLSNPNSDDIDSSISNWAISPVVWFQNGDSISFYTYSTGQTEPVPIIGGTVPDRLQLRMTRVDSTSNTGILSKDVGSFVNPLLDINPNLGDDYPGTWTRYSVVITGLNQPFQGRFAFRYFVPDFYNHGWGVHIDKVTYTSKSH